ncbi:MAG TPA: hypothetical protein DCQ06_10225 [Myxococcales bacterium]|nr:hypothetical protein [Myxococcales bacterium]
MLAGVLTLGATTTACGRKKTPPPAKPVVPAPATKQQAAVLPPAAAVTPTAAKPVAKPAAKQQPKVVKVDPRQNGWGIKSAARPLKVGDRAFVVTRGRDRSHTNVKAVYHLYAYDIRGVNKDLVTLKEVGGGDFQVSASFVMPSGETDLKRFKPGQLVLAEWASSLKHAIVLKVLSKGVRIRYLDLPDSWKEDKLQAVKKPRELTIQTPGLSRGNFAVMKRDGREYLVMLVAETGPKWLVQRFAGRVETVAKTELTPIPLKPKLRRRSKVSVPWVGMMYPGVVQRVRKHYALVKVSATGQRTAMKIPLGQLLPR